MNKKFEINWTKIKGSCQSGRKVVSDDSKSDLPLSTHRSDTYTHKRKIGLVSQFLSASNASIIMDLSFSFLSIDFVVEAARF